MYSCVCFRFSTVTHRGHGRFSNVFKLTVSGALATRCRRSAVAERRQQGEAAGVLASCGASSSLHFSGDVLVGRLPVPEGRPGTESRALLGAQSGRRFALFGAKGLLVRSGSRDMLSSVGFRVLVFRRTESARITTHGATARAASTDTEQ